MVYFTERGFTASRNSPESPLPLTLCLHQSPIIFFNRNEVTLFTLLNNATITTNGSAIITNDGSLTPSCEFDLTVGIPTGVSPTITFTFDFSDDGITFLDAHTMTTITAAGTFRRGFDNMYQEFTRLSWVVSSGASFPGVTVTCSGGEGIELNIQEHNA